MKCEISGHVQNTEAVVQRCSVKKVFLEVSQNSQENICTRVSFLIKLQASDLRTPFSKNTFFYKTPLVAASKNNITMQTIAKFASNSTANIKLSKHLSFFSLDFEQVLYKK